MKVADLICINGNIRTLCDGEERKQALVVQEGNIVYVGNEREALAWKGDQTQVIDLRGKTMLPGFIESHSHPTVYGMNLLEVDCRPIETPSIESMLDKLSDEVKRVPQEQWIRGWGWDDSQLAEKRFPTRWDLDRVAPEHPVVLKRTCNHMVVVNSKALERSGITKQTRNPIGGHIDRDEKTGELTGLLQEKAQGLVNAPEYDVNQLIQGMKLAEQQFHKWGITTIHDMSTQTKDLQAYQILLEQDELNVRIRPWIWAIDQNGWKGQLNDVLHVGMRSGFGNDMLNIQGMKFMLDGGIGGKTAALRQPYQNDTNRGILYNTVEEIEPLFFKSLQSGLRISVHAIGDRAIDVAIRSFEKAHGNLDITNMRNRIEHCIMPTNAHLEKMKKMQLIAASSIGFLYHLGDSYMKNVGAKRMKQIFPHRSFQEHGIIAPGNSDLPVTDGNPWAGIYAAVTRKTLSGQTINPHEKISVSDALKAYTSDAAYSSFEEKKLGVLKPSAKADLIVVSDDPLQIDVDQLKDLEVEQTYVNGKRVYSKSLREEKGYV